MTLHSREVSLERPAEKPLRVAFLLRDAGEGGAERSSLRLANGLARRNVEVTLLLLRVRGPLLGSIDPAIRTVDLHSSFLRLLQELRARPTDFLLPVYTSMRTLLAKRMLGGPFRVVLSQRNMFTMDRGPLQTRLRFLRCRLLYPAASACVCISNGVAGEMRGLHLLPPDRIRVIYNPVVTDELLEEARAPVPHPWLAPGEPPVVLGAGRLGDQKDFATLVRAFALLARDLPDVRLIVLGEGKQRRMLERLIEEKNLTGRTLLPGYSPNPYAWMSRAAVFALTSRFEGFGNVVAEALACGCNVVSTDCPSGPSEILDGGRYGRLARVGDPEDVARALREALSHPLPFEDLRGRAAFFSEERAAEAWLELFRDLASS